MALGPCRECNRQVSSEARTCPHCGVSKPVRQASPLALGCGGLLALLVLGQLGQLFTSGTKPAANPVPPTPTGYGWPVESDSAKAAEAKRWAAKQARADSLLKALSTAGLRRMPESTLALIHEGATLHGPKYAAVQRELDRRHKVTRAPAPARSVCAYEDGRAGPGYQGLVANTWEGQELYLKSDCAYIGQIVGIESDHTFPDGTVRDGVLIHFGSGDVDWVPRKAAQLLYVAKE